MFDTEQNYAWNNIILVFIKETALVPAKHLQKEAPPDQRMVQAKAG